jgi:putative membrane protein
MLTDVCGATAFRHGKGVPAMKILSSLLMMFLATGAFAGSSATPEALLGKLAQGGMTEVEAGKLAQAKGTAPGVKEFGAMMVKDHSAANEKVKALAASRNVTLPQTPSAEQKETMKGLQMQKGAQFDQAYVQAQVKAHEKTVAMLKAEIASGRDADTKALAQELLPTVESHLKEAYRLAGKD